MSYSVHDFPNFLNSQIHVEDTELNRGAVGPEYLY